MTLNNNSSQDMHRLDQITMSSIPRTKDQGTYQNMGSLVYTDMMPTNQTGESFIAEQLTPHAALSRNRSSSLVKKNSAR
jgi:hypothetical protein